MLTARTAEREWRVNAMPDLIERHALVKEISKYHITSGITAQATWNECVDIIIGVLESFPSAQQERKTARWEILYPNHTYKYHCSECGANHKYMFDFCPSCGAYMGDENDAIS